MKKSPQFELKWQEKIQNFKVNSGNFDWRYKAKGMSDKKQKKRHFKEKICKIYTKFHNFTWQNSLNQIWNDRRKCRILKWIQRSLIEHSHWNENGRKTRKENDIWKKNLENLHKISQFETNKLTESDWKWQKKMQNFKTNSTKFDWRFNWRCKWENIHRMWHIHRQFLIFDED